MPIIYSAQIAQMQVQAGPLPPPELLRQYEAITAGLVDRIVKMAEDEAQHRRKMEAEIVAVQSRDQQAYRRAELLGQVCGLSIGVFAIGGAVFCSVRGAQIAGAFIGTTGVTGLVTAFILGRTFLMKQRQQEIRQQQTAAAQREAALNHAQSAEAKGKDLTRSQV